MDVLFTPAAEHWFAVALVFSCLAILAAWTLRQVLRWASEEVDRMVDEALSEAAADFGEPTRAQVEVGLERLLTAIGGLDEATETLIFPDPSFVDTPIYQQLRHESDVIFAAQVLADIDGLPGGDAA